MPRAPTLLDVGVKPDCLVEWRGAWFSSKILERKQSSGQLLFHIHYLGYDASWDEWVGSERIRFVTNSLAPDAQIP
jgi:hypothetical protein